MYQCISHCELALGRVFRESRIEGCLARSPVAGHLRAQGLVPWRLPVLLTDLTSRNESLEVIVTGTEQMLADKRGGTDNDVQCWWVGSNAGWTRLA